MLALIGLSIGILGSKTVSASQWGLEPLEPTCGI